MIDLTFKQAVLIFELFGLTLHLGLQTFILEILHFDSFSQFADLKFHQALSVILGSLYLSNLMHNLPLVSLLMSFELIILIHFELVALIMKFRYLVQQSLELSLVRFLLSL
jgi:hypothetical protein